MKKILWLAVTALLAIANVQAQVPAEVKQVMEKCNAAMTPAAGMEYHMEAKTSMGPVSLMTMNIVMGSKGDKERSLVTTKVVGKEVVFEAGYDGSMSWERQQMPNSRDSIIISTGKKEGGGDDLVDLGLCDEFKKAKMKEKDDYYDITFSDPKDKDSELKSISLKVSKKNYLLREMRTGMKGARVVMTFTKYKVGLKDDYFKLDFTKYPNAVIVRKQAESK